MNLSGGWTGRDGWKRWGKDVIIFKLKFQNQRGSQSIMALLWGNN